MIPTPVRPMTTPKTMSHGGVSYVTGPARVGRMSMNSRVESLSRKALLMRFLDFLYQKFKSSRPGMLSDKTCLLLAAFERKIFTIKTLMGAGQTAAWRNTCT